MLAGGKITSLPVSPPGLLMVDTAFVIFIACETLGQIITGPDFSGFKNWSY